MNIKCLFLGMLAGNAAGALLVGLAIGLTSVFPNFFMGISLPSLLIIPFCIGVVASWVWKPLRLETGAVVLHSFFCTCLGLYIAAIFLHEGVICLVIVSPILYAGVLIGALFGRIWFRPNRDRFNICVVPLLVIMVATELAMRAPETSVVTDEIRVVAPPATVWPHVLAFKTIPEPPAYWLFRIGLPYPTETTNDGNFVGADRACRFSGGAVFKEKVTEIEPGRKLTFAIVEMPADPELLGHLDARRGQFELRDNGDGTTTLIGRTWYSLHVGPAWYFDWWTQNIFSAVHLRVMRNIKQLAESGR